MYSHITVGTNNMASAMRFYDTVLATIGLKRKRTYKAAMCYAPEEFIGSVEPFWVMRPYDRKPAVAGNGPMVAFAAPTRAAVDAFYSTAMAQGGSDEGPPALRGHYHPNYYGAYVRDPDGNKLCVVCHAPAADV